MAKKRKRNEKRIEIGGNVSIKNGDFVGGDKTISVGARGVYIGGNLERSTVTTGDHNRVRNELFDEIFKKIEKRPETPPEDKEELKTNIEELKGEAEKGDDADETFLSRRLRNIARIAPDIAEIVLATLANPAAGFAMIVKKVAERARKPAGT